MKPHDAFLDLDVVERHGMTPSPETACQVKKAGAEAIKRILKAVRKEHIPPGLDREALRIEIGQAYFSRVDLFEGSKAQKRVKRLRSMHKTADKLARLIKADRTMGVWIQGTLDRAHSSGSAPPALPMSFLPTPLSAPPKAPAITVVLEQLQLAIAIVEHHQKVIAEKWRKGHAPVTKSSSESVG